MAGLARRALNSGPSPSEASVDDGADTQTLRNSALPSLNCSSCSKLRLAAENEKMSRLTIFLTVPAPPGVLLEILGCEKSVGRRGDGARRAPGPRRVRSVRTAGVSWARARPSEERQGEKGGKRRCMGASLRLRNRAATAACPRNRGVIPAKAGALAATPARLQRPGLRGMTPCGRAPSTPQSATGTPRPGWSGCRSARS